MMYARKNNMVERDAYRPPLVKNFWELFCEQWRYNLNGWEAYFVVDWPCV